jgi:hypothetical protein
MTKLLRYIERNSGYSDNGPAWIDYDIENGPDAILQRSRVDEAQY